MSETTTPLDALAVLYMRRDGKMRYCQFAVSEMCNKRRCDMNGCAKAIDILEEAKASKK